MAEFGSPNIIWSKNVFSEIHLADAHFSDAFFAEYYINEKKKQTHSNIRSISG